MNINAFISFTLTIILFCDAKEATSKAAYIKTNGDEVNYGFQLVETEATGTYVARAQFSNTIEQNGWSSLYVDSNPKYPDHLQAYWSGYLETTLTRSLTIAHWQNTFKLISDHPKDAVVVELAKFIKTNMQFTINASISMKTDTWWYPIYLHLWQLKGVEDAYKGDFIARPSNLNDTYLRKLMEDPLGINLLQLSGDVWSYLQLAARKISKPTERTDIMKYLKRLPSPSNSLLFKIHNGDILIGQVTGAPYSTMLRVLKSYNFPWKSTSEGNQTLNGSRIVFSSYPSVTSSYDDFYITNKELVILETSIPIYNDTLYDKVEKQINSSVLTFLRAMKANRVAGDAIAWIEAFRKRNSGTFNNEWFIFNAKLFKSGIKAKHLPQGTLILLAQLPGITQSKDVSEVLMQNESFAGFNIPYLEEIYNLTGLREREDKFKDGFYTRDKMPRNIMFKKKQNQIKDVESMRKVMRYNNYLKDPLSQFGKQGKKTATKAISARRDLNNETEPSMDPNYKFYLSGGIDAKVVNLTLIEKQEMVADCGPTHDKLSPFDWSKWEGQQLQFILTEHELQPTLFKFKPYTTKFHRMNSKT